METHEIRRRFARMGVKATHQRLVIYRELVATREHPSAVAVWERVREEIPTLSLDTVYRALASFEAAGLATRVPTGGERFRYDGDVSPHHHLVCVSCGRIEDVGFPGFSPEAAPVDRSRWARVIDAQVLIRGLCRSCQETLAVGRGKGGDDPAA